MQAIKDDRGRSNWHRAACRVYQAILLLYPKSFRRRFGSEMNAIFLEAFDDCKHQGRLHLFVFLARELLEAPYNILNQHISEENSWFRSTFANLLPFTLGFILIGLLSTWNEYQDILKDKEWIFIFGYILAGGISGLAIGNVVAPHEKRLFAVGGAVSVLWVIMQFGQLCFLAFMINLFYPLLVGCIIGLFLLVADGKFNVFFHWAGMGFLASLTGFFVNRLSAALIQSYIFHSPMQDIITTGLLGLLAYIVVPFLLEGLLLSMFMSGNIKRKQFSTG